MIVTMTSLKGGTGKTTISGLWALYLAECCHREVVLLDLDPQGGATCLFLGGKSSQPGFFDLLDSEMHDQSAVLFRDYLQPSNVHPDIYVLPADPRLHQLSKEETPVDLLASLLEKADLPPNTIILIDTGTMRMLVGMGIAAADAVVVPMMLSPQAIKPTINTLAMIQHLGTPLLGLVPVAAGSARWEAELLLGWEKTLSSRFPNLQFVTPTEHIFPPLSSAKSLVRGSWAASGFPERFTATFEALEEGLHSIEQRILEAGKA